MKKKDWLKIKKYAHLLPKLTNEDRPFIRNYVSDKKRISSHRFYPFIRHTLKESKWRRGKIGGLRHKYRSLKKKSRDIFYANHLDAQVFAYYSYILTAKLEIVYDRDPVLSKSVTAYRRVKHESSNRNKSSIDFAKELFDEVKSRGDECAVLCFDVVSFFDNLDHRILKKAWKRLLDTEELSPDHYAVFKNITKFSYVELGELFKEFPEYGVTSKSQRKFSKLDSFCKDNSEFRSRVVQNGLIKSKNSDDKQDNQKRGIPQGSPISSTLSNLYMLEFDREFASIAKNNDEFYRRYSDDIVYVCSVDRISTIKNKVIEQFSNKLMLEVSKPKLQEFIFSRISPNIQSSRCKIGDQTFTNLKLQYLGFEFDGKAITIKNSALSRFYRKTKRLIRRKGNYARRDKINKENNNKNKNLDDHIYRERIYKSKTHLGAKRKKVLGKVFWGNFISYAYHSSDLMGDPAIRRQVKNHWRIVESQIQKVEKKYKLSKTPSKKNKK